MFWALLPTLALLLSDGAPPSRIPAPQPVDFRLVAAYWEPGQIGFDARAERDLLDLANRARQRAGLGPLAMDEGLTHAAREHATEMALRGQISHQFSGEAALAQRLAKDCSLYIVEAGENVASAENVDRAHDGLMRSPHHRDNLLRPSFNVAGFAVVRRGDTLYVVQDFGNSMPARSQAQAEGIIAKMVDHKRAQAELPRLQKRETRSAGSACAMAQNDSLKPAAYGTPAGRHILRYTSTQPENLPEATGKILEDESITAYSVEACFSRSQNYPSGVYWVVLTFYSAFSVFLCAHRALCG
jgi:Cysteine-rich secretory protein family